MLELCQLISTTADLLATSTALAPQFQPNNSSNTDWHSDLALLEF